MGSDSDRKCIFILGMHRSGTSALSGCLQMAGLDLGKKIMHPQEDNPKGFFENLAIAALNEQILEEMYLSWNDTLLIPENYWRSESFDRYRQQLSRILYSEFSGKDDMLIKDPRLSVLLPIYLEVLESLKIKPVILISVRNPMEIISSLVSRDNLSEEKILLLWMDHQLKAEYYSRQLPRMFISYPDFLQDPVSIMQNIKEKLSIDLNLELNNRPNILSFLDKELRHHHYDDLSPDYQSLPDLKEVYRLMSAASGRDISESEISALDAIKVRFNHCFHFYNGLARKFLAKVILTDDEGRRKNYQFNVNYGRRVLTVSGEGLRKITKVVLMPSNSSVGLGFITAAIRTEAERITELKEMNTNADYEFPKGVLLFETEIPQITFEMMKPVNLHSLTFHLDYYSFGNYTYKMGYIRRDMIENLSTELDQSKERKVEIKAKMKAMEREIEAIHGSLTWKTGKFITAPFRWIYDIIRKKNAGQMAEQPTEKY